MRKLRSSRARPEASVKAWPLVLPPRGSLCTRRDDLRLRPISVVALCRCLAIPPTPWPSRVFERIEAERGRLDVLVNSAWGGYERMAEDGQFTWPAPFWLQPLWRWEAMIAVGVRGAFVASQHAARLMVPARQGLIVHLSSWAARSTSAMSRTALQRRRPTSWRPTWRTSSSLMASLLCQCTQVLSEPRRCWPQVSSI